MPSESKPLLAAQTEKPNHYKYLKEFRVEQCPSFLQHKCTQHRPFTCFHWHFNNQRRRRPVRKRDGTFNYSADNYCTKYNETSGICEDGDECPYLHRTAGDTERRYHLRYYKTCMCVHDTDARGLCTKNGAHCAFAHGAPDLRPPVLDMRELQALDNPDAADADAAAPNALDRERNQQIEDPKWQDTNYVLSSYKTEPCKRPPRLCRQGYACPQYHNSKDKRRSPRKYKYRSTPCPNVKHGEEWGEPSNCEAGDACGYCHTRTEQQFHPEIYKSTKCNDVQQAGYCPRGLFCAFAHVEPEELGARELAGALDCGTSLADLLSSALPPDKKPERAASPPHALPLSNGSGDGSECASTSPPRPAAGRAPCPGPPSAVRQHDAEAPVFQLAAMKAGSFRAAARFEFRAPSPVGAARAVAPARGGWPPPSPAVARWTKAPFGARRPASACGRGGSRGGGGGGARAALASGQTATRPRGTALSLRRELDAARAALAPRRDLRGLPLTALKALQAQARLELEDIEKVLYLETATKCMVCEEQPRSVTLAPCNHYVLCDACAATTAECPYCQTPVQHHQ
uniref:RING-type E3 ubiquitin transferase n=1 Tax=Heliothis virescens TaxID=7102 RepID=A0A2A4JL62_HELVI